MHIFRTLLAILVVSSLATGAVAAQAGGGTPTPAPDAGDAPQQVAPGLKLYNATWTGDAVRLVLEADSPTAVSVYGAMSITDSGEPPSRSVALDAGEKTTVEVKSAVLEGYAGVLIISGNDVFKETVEVDPSLFSGEPTWSTVQLVGAGGIFGSVLAVGIGAWRRRGGGKKQVSQTT
jgi:hypothetical protein